MKLYPTNNTVLIKGYLKKELTEEDKKLQKEEKTEGVLDYLEICRIGKEVKGFKENQKVMLRRGALADQTRMINAEKGKKEDKVFYLIVDPEEILGFWK